MSNLQIMGGAIRELLDSPLLLLHPASRTLLEGLKAAYSELLKLREEVDKLKAGPK